MNKLCTSVLFLLLWKVGVAGSPLIEWYAGRSHFDVIVCLSVDANIADRFSGQSGTSEQYTVRDHTSRVLQNFKIREEYWETLSSEMRDTITRKDFELFLALHDIAKAESNVTGKGKTYELSKGKEIFLAIASDVGMKEDAKNLLSSLLNNDSIGGYLGDSVSLIQCVRFLSADRPGFCSSFDFASLQIFFHRLDCATYPTLRGVFGKNYWDYNTANNEKIKRLLMVLDANGLLATKKTSDAISDLSRHLAWARDMVINGLLHDGTDMFPQLSNLVIQMREAIANE